VRSRRGWLAALLAAAVIGLAVAAAVVWGDDDEATSTSSTTTSSTEPSTTTSDSPPTSDATTTTSTAGVAPERVTGVEAYPGGGSGEIELRWDATAGATGYRVLRATSSDGAFETAAEIDVTTGETTAAPGVANIWSASHSYLPGDGALDQPDGSPWFRYVETGAAERCFEVVASGPGGDAPASEVVCSSAQ
jgi:hypothetical protein